MSSRIISLTTTLIPILIIGIGMNVYNSAKSTIDESVSNMQQSEISAFNSTFEGYEGTQTGSQTKALIGDLIVNASTYEDEVSKIPGVTIVDKINKEGDSIEDAKKPEESDDVEEYKNNLTEIRNKLEDKHTYNIELEYEDELVNEIKISYENY